MHEIIIDIQMTKPTYPLFTENLKPARVELNLRLISNPNIISFLSNCPSDLMQDSRVIEIL